MNAFTIKDIENLSGIKAHTIRIWEQRYSFLKPKRTDTNIRCYDNQQLGAILNIALLNKNGFKISHINNMSEEEINAKILSITQGQAYQERIVNQLISKMINVDLHGLEKTMDDYIRKNGIESTIMHIIFPFLERIGILWQTNHINPAQEHFVTNIIRQKIIVGIDKLQPTEVLSKTILLFLPSGEYHEIGLLFMHFLLKSRGINVLYVGANIPLKDIEGIIHLKKPDYIYTHLTSVAHNFNLKKFISTFSEKLPDHNLIISGLITQSIKIKTPPNVFLKRSFAEVQEFILSL